MEQIHDVANVLLTDTKIRKGDKLKLRVEVYWDEQTNAQRLRITDERSDTDATRAIHGLSDGSITMQQVVDMMPDMVEEIIVLNRLGV